MENFIIKHMSIMTEDCLNMKPGNHKKVEEIKEEEEWALTFKSVVCFGHIEIEQNHEKIIEQCRRLARKFYPTEESIESVIERSGHRVNMLVMSIDHMTGKRVKEK